MAIEQAGGQRPFVDEEDPTLSPITDPTDWEVVEDGIRAAPRLGARISIRLDPDMAHLVMQAARVEGINLVEFVRRAALQAAAAVVAREPVTEPNEAHPGT